MILRRPLSGFRSQAYLGACLAIFAGTVSPSPGQGPGASIERRLPPRGIEIPESIRTDLEARIAELDDRAWGISSEAASPDAEIFIKAVDLALVHGEIYEEKQLPLLEVMAQEGERRLAKLEEGEAPWADDRGLLVRGYRSKIDGSVQPYGLEIPEGLDLSQPVPLLVWLHGRGDKVTDLHFIQRCLTRSQALGGKIVEQQDAIVVHPFGRQCVGWKHAGEIDVFEVIESVKSRYPIDPDRIALAGFSMGGAGAWHIGAHYTDRFCAIHAGAGFAETARYNRLTPEDFPNEVEQTLWSIYDVPNYVRNLFNVPVLAYSGENDKQKQAADVMAEAFAKEGRELRHLVGPGMGHKYDDVSVEKIWAFLQKAWEGGRPVNPDAFKLQTRTPRYGRMHWVEITAQVTPWEDTWVDARRDEVSRTLTLKTENVAALGIGSGSGEAEWNLAGMVVRIDEQVLQVESPGFPIGSVRLRRDDEGQWDWGEVALPRKIAGTQGPIDDAFLEPFVVVKPAKESKFPAVQRWMDLELPHFVDRWRALMRAELSVEDAEDLDHEDLQERNLVLWGEPETNLMIAEIAGDLPLRWTETEIQMGDRSWPRDSHLPAFIFPNPLNPRRYVVINSGLTFREDHDRTNSLQNPKLGDWSIIGLDEPPSGKRPGRIAAHGFFDRAWSVTD